MRRQVAKLLRIFGTALEQTGGTKDAKDGDKEIKPRPPRVKPLPIEPKDPPTFIRIMWDHKKEIPFYANQRRYVRVETDANSDYHDPDNPSTSRLNIAVGDDLRVFGTSPLKGGRMRIGIECLENVVVGSTGSIRIELYRKGLPALSDEQEYGIVEPPAPKEQERRSTLPDIKITPVAGPEDDNWEYICDDPDDADIGRHASNYMMNDGTLHVYYSEVFPRFATEVRRFEQQNEALANSFRSRYGIWIAVHSVLCQQITSEDTSDIPEEVAQELGRQERARLAVIAAMVASQEVKSGISDADEDDTAA